MNTNKQKTRYADSLVTWIDYLSRGISSVIITILFFVTVYLINGRPFGMMKLQDITGGVNIPDMEFTYSVGSLYSLLEALGEAGRNFYLTSIIPLDFIFPACYGLFLAILLSYIIRKTDLYETGWRYVVILPVIGALMDYAENFLFLTILLHYPHQMPVIATFASVCTLVKWIFNRLSFLLIGGGIIYAIFLYFKR